MCTQSFEKINGTRQKQGATQPLGVVHINVGLCKGTSEHPLCVRRMERLKWRAGELNCSALSLAFCR